MRVPDRIGLIAHAVGCEGCTVRPEDEGGILVTPYSLPMRAVPYASVRLESLEGLSQYPLLML